MEILKYKKFIQQINEGLIHTYNLSHIDSYFRIALEKMIESFTLNIDNDKKVFNLKLETNLEKIPLLLNFINSQLLINLETELNNNPYKFIKYMYCR